MVVVVVVVGLTAITDMADPMDTDDMELELIAVSIMSFSNLIVLGN